jgi:Xaa-Pro aminopeptidase
MPEPLKPGMTVTDEPGVYLAGRFGIRTENTMLVVEAGETEFGKFFRLDPLTLCPIDTTPIVVEMLTEEERQWFDAYHKRVREALMPLLSDDEEKEWLRKVTQPLV